MNKTTKRAILATRHKDSWWLINNRKKNDKETVYKASIDNDGRQRSS